MTTELVIILSVVIGLAILLWLFLEGKMMHLWPVEQVTDNNLKIKTMVWGGLTLTGIALVGVGILFENPIAIAGGIVAVVGFNFFLAYLYKLTTGRDTSGMRFWKAVGRTLIGKD